MIVSPQEIIISTQSIHTNTLIRMEIPQNLLNSNYFCQWVNESNQQIKDNYILTRFGINKNNKANQFQCTPLDYGAIIRGRILVLQNENNQIVKQVRYGPVIAEPLLCQFIKTQHTLSKKTQVSINLSKNIRVEGSIKIDNLLHTKNNTNQNKLTIMLQSKQFKFEIKIDQNIRLPSNNSFFKFYDKQQNNLGISIYHQHSEFMEKLKQVIPGHNLNFIGFYIKINFKDRLCRDSFLFLLMKQLKVQFEDTNLYLSQEFQLNSKQSKKEQKKLQKNQNNSEKKTSVIKQIDDEIFKLLYQASQAGNQISLDLADAQILLSSNKLDIVNRSAMKQSDLKNNENKNFLAERKQNKLFEVIRQKGNSFFERDSLQNKSKQKNIINPKPPQINISPHVDVSQKQNQLRNTIANLTNQIKNLLKQNRKLAYQNQRLKDENMKLRLKQIKNNSIVNLTPYQKSESNYSKSISPFNHHKRQSINLYKLTDKLTISKNFNSNSIQNLNTRNILEIPQHKQSINGLNGRFKLSSSSKSILMGNKLNNPDRNMTAYIPIYSTSPQKQSANKNSLQLKQSLLFSGFSHHQSLHSLPNPQARFISCNNNKQLAHHIPTSQSTFIQIQTPIKNLHMRKTQVKEYASHKR